jgi:predicted permease
MIALQFAAALVQLACATFFLQGLEFMSQRDPGWKTAGLVQGTLSPPQARYTTPEQTYNFYLQVQERLAALPGAESVSVAWTNPLYLLLATRKYVVTGREPPAPGREPLALVNGVNPTFRETLGIKLNAGRDFTESDRLGSAPVVMINQSMANALFPEGSPLGHHLIVPGAESSDPLEIVGVFSDVGMAGNPAPVPTPFQVFVPLAQECWNYVTVSVRSERPTALIEPFRQVIAELDPSLPVQALSTTEEAAAVAIKQMAIVSTLLTAFGILGLFLASLGLYGVIARLVVQRTPEIGVRLALGAQLRNVMWLVLGSGLRLTLIGTVIGFLLSVVLAFLLSAFFGGEGRVDFVSLLGVTVLLLGVAMLASYLPARRATKVNPLEALRAD